MRTPGWGEGRRRGGEGAAGVGEEAGVGDRTATGQGGSHAVGRGRRGVRARKGGGSEGLGVAASRVKRPSVPDVLIGALPIWFL